MAQKSIPTREQLPTEYTWELSHLFESDAQWSEQYSKAAAYAEALAAYQGRLGESGATLLEFFRLDDEASLCLERLYTYANCKSDQDTANSFYRDMRGKAMSVYVAVSSAAAFASPEIIAIEQSVLDSFYESVPQLEEYRRSIYRIRRRAEHSLSAAEERLLSAAAEMADAPDNICSVFRNAELSFPDVTDSEGQSRPLTNETLVPCLESSDRLLRKNAFETYYTRLGQFKNTVAAALDGQFRQLRFFAAARRYESTLDAALHSTEVPKEVYLNLIDAVHGGLESMYRYVRLRRRLLGLDQVHMYDVYTPIVEDAAAAIDYETACEKVLEALSVLGEDYTELLRRGFEERWIDVYENQGKRGGAYSTGSARPHPYVLLNHKDTLDSMFTIAHEMGHALHSYYSCLNQPVSRSDYVIFVAEVASTCNEVLLMEHLLGRTEDKKQRAYLINHFLDQFKGTLFRQTMFAEFELEMGRMSEAGETLTADALCEKYLALNKLYFGPDMVSDEHIALEWARIPHFFYNYYVFQYATGFSAAVALAMRILSGEAGAVDDYKRFLSSGGSADPISLLKIAGVDMSDPAPIRSALELFDRLLNEMEELI